MVRAPLKRNMQDRSYGSTTSTSLLTEQERQEYREDQQPTPEGQQQQQQQQQQEEAGQAGRQKEGYQRPGRVTSPSGEGSSTSDFLNVDIADSLGEGDENEDDDDHDKAGSCCGIRTYVILCVGLTGLTSILLGYDIGIMSGAKLQIQRYMNLSDQDVELMVGILNFVSAFGGLVSGRLSDYIGRKKTVAMACVLFIAGSLLMAFSRDYMMLMAGRVVTGLGVGSGLAIAPLYMAELSPKRARGALVSFNEVAVNLGLLIGFIGGYGFSRMDPNMGWRWMLGMGAIPPVLILASLVFLPESPRWLVKHRSQGEALAVLMKTCSSIEARRTLEKLKTEVAGGDSGSFRELMQGGRNLVAMLIAAMGVNFFQQASGIEALVYYVPEVLEDSGIQNEQEQLLANMGIGTVKVLFIFVAMRLSDKLGRRWLLIASAFGMTAAYVVTAMSFEFGNIFQLTIAGIGLFMAFFSIGFGPLAWVVASEVVPLNVRGIAMGASTFINRILSGTIAMSYLSLKAALTSAGTFYLFGGVALLSAAFVYFFVPETKGRALEEIEQAMDDLPIRKLTKRRRHHNVSYEQFDNEPDEEEEAVPHAALIPKSDRVFVVKPAQERTPSESSI